jgi:prolyl-tRNA synthetase
MRRDKIRDGDKLASEALAFNEFVEAASSLLMDIQSTLFDEAKARLDKNIRTDINTVEALETYFGPAQEDEEAADDVKGWVRCAWSKPSGSTLENIVDRLKVLKLTIRNAPRDQPKSLRPCIFTGEPGVEEILVARAY